jgi:nitrogen fixation/metabolism regulation signal transduction histidine kinase
VEFDLDKTLENLINIAAVKASEKGLDFLLRHAEGIPLLRGDPLRLGQILLNLVNNAIKFTDSGAVKVSIEEVSRDEQRLILRFAVVDSGIGMNEEQLSRLFQAFSQADTSTTRKYGGTGLGLTIVKNLVELMGGEVVIKSKRDEGTTFTITLHDIALSDEEIKKQVTNNMEVRFEKATVLIADDIKLNRDLLSEYLKGTPLEIIEVNDGQEAVEVAKAQDIDLILTDIKMPTMDGYEASKAIKKTG